MNTRALCTNGNGAPAPQAVVLPATVAVAAPAPLAVTPMEMLDRAIANGAGIEVLSKLMDLQDRWQANAARRAFDAAIAAAKAELPVIVKNCAVDFTSAKGRTNYRYEDFAGIARTVDPILSRHGLNYRFRTTCKPGEPLSVTCILSHRDGHAEENTLCAGHDESGNKNSIQSIGSTQTYLQRYTLKAALGLAASNDDDGRSASASDYVTAAQAATLRQALKDAGRDEAKFCAWAKVATLAEIYSSRFDAALAAIRRAGARAS